MASPDEGFSYLSYKRSTYTRSDHANFVPSAKLLPPEVAPYEKQIRVFVGSTEYTWYDDNALIRPTSNYWTYTAPVAPTTGVRCWGIRMTADSIGEGISDDLIFYSLGIEDEDGEVVLDSTWSTTFTDSAFDRQSGTTYTNSSQNITNETILFPTPLNIVNIGWTRAPNSVDTCENMKLEVNVGTPTTPNWILFGDNTLHQVQTPATPHVAGDELVIGNYPLATPNPLTNAANMCQFTSSTNGLAGRDLDAPAPTITIEPALTLASDRITMLRETRQSEPWVEPISGGYGRGYGIWWYFEQIRMIVQDTCELAAVSDLIGYPLADIPLNDRSFGSQAQTHAGGGTTLSFASVELLDWVPGASFQAQDQIVVERGTLTDGTSTNWEELSYSASPSDEDAYSVDSSARTITFGAANTKDIRIRRVTRTDAYWVDLRDTLAASGWNNAWLNLALRQARFMIEEACMQPAFYTDSPLSSSIYPRVWNWLDYVGTRNQWTIPGPIWGGDGSVVVWKNNVKLTQDTDYTLSSPNINFTVPPVDGDTTTIATGGGGFGGGHIFGGDGDPDETTPSEPLPIPLDETPDVDWPGLNFPADLNVTVSLSSVPEGYLSGAFWEGGTSVDFSQGNSTDTNQFGENVLRVQLTVISDGTVTDGGGGTYMAGTTEVLYINKICFPETSSNVRKVAGAWKLDPNDAWTSDEASPSFGCLSQSGITGNPGLWTKSNAGDDVNNTSHPTLRFLADLFDVPTRAGGDVDNVLFMGSYRELVEQANFANDNGIGDGSFTNEQWEDYLDPDTTFNDFDVPVP